MIRPILKKTPYELFRERKPNISYFHSFGCKCFVLNNEKDNLGKFDAKSDENIFLGYSLTSNAFKVFNKRISVVEESIYVIFDESNPPSRKDFLDDDDVGILQKNIDEPSQERELNDPQVIEKELSYPRERLYVNDGKIIGDLNQGVKTKSSYRNICEYVAFLSQLEPKNVKKALNDDHWIIAM